MAENDRRTGIDGDQITDHTIEPSELKTEGDIDDPQNWQILMWNKSQQMMKWFYSFGNRIFR